MFDNGYVFDQPANAQRADRRCAASLLVGQSIRHRKEAAVVIPQILQQALALSGNGHGYYGHAAFFPGRDLETDVMERSTRTSSPNREFGRQ